MPAHFRAPTPALPARLPHGLWRDGAPLRELQLRAASERDHAFLLDTLDAGMTPGARGTALLERCLENAPAGAAQALGAGDREALLLQLRMQSHGDALNCVLRCPSRECDEALELALRVSELLLPAYADAAPEHTLRLTHGDARYEVRFRLPNAGDLDHTAALARDDGPGAGLALLARCVLCARVDGAQVEVRALPVAVCDAVAEAIAGLDPQAGIEFDMTCPACGRAFVAELDAASLLLEELDARARQSLREVHILASQYGWSECEILSMSAARRARYVELILAMQRAGAGS